jgi:large subunit ribosomal protein L4e
MTKANVFDIEGKKAKQIELPKVFSEKIREDVVTKVLEAKKNQQPYAPSLVAGKQQSAKGKIHHLRHVWKSGYGRGTSRAPRKIMSRRGSQFNWEGAEAPYARKGMRAHPPKVIEMLTTKKVNKKELELALKSAISASGNEKKVSGKYQRLEDHKIESLPFVVEGKLTSLKTKNFLESMKKILGEKLFDVAVKKKTIRAGKGKMRGRKYKKNAGMLIVVGNKEKLKTNAVDVKNAANLSVVDLAQGGLGRLTMYTEEAIKNLGERLK